MTQPIDSQTPLILVSELRSRINADTTKTDVDNRLLNVISQTSQIFQQACRRRFDEYVETRYYTPTHISVGGDLFGLRELRLDADLKSYTTIINGDGATVNPGYVQLMPLNSSAKSVIRINPYATQFWYHAGVTDPVGSVSVAGMWGFGGQWIGTGITVTSGLASDATATSFVSSAALEAGMVLQIGSEQLYISAATSSAPYTNTVTRGFNGTTGAVHANGTAITRWQPLLAVRQCVTRLVMWALEQDKSPLFGQAVVGDIAIPVTVDSWPKDVLATIRTNGLMRPPRITSV